jgi:mRNA-degrading endonuclease RelE of RelBE toxin-antitoxin system
MRWRVRLTRSALRHLPKLDPSREEIQQVVDHLDRLEMQPLPGENVPFIIDRDLLYSDIGRFRVIFQLRRSKWYPQQRLIVLSFILIP